MLHTNDNLAELLVWDAEGRAPIGSFKTVLWRDFGDLSSPNNFSLPRIVEENSEILRKRYLSWIFDLGETCIESRRLVDCLDLSPSLSYWWMTLFVEKCNYSKSPHIDDAIRFMAMDSYVNSEAVQSVRFVGASPKLAKVLASWAVQKGFTFTWQQVEERRRSQSSWIEWLYRKLPHPIQGLSWLVVRVLQRWPLRKCGLVDWINTNGQVTFVSYSDNLVPSEIEKGHFVSRYWGHLPDELKRYECNTNWIHLYSKDVLLPNAKKAARTINQFNKSAGGAQSHITLDTFLSVKVILNTLRDWFRLMLKGGGLWVPLSKVHADKLSLWPLFDDEWSRTIFGQVALSNILFIHQFRAALDALPKQRLCVYLQENQGWERALLDAWKAASHGEIVSVSHSTVRFWDLRYFYDSRSYVDHGKNKMPMPDKIAINGPAMMAAYLHGGCPEERLISVEALRYLHLANIKARDNDERKNINCPVRVLVVGDYLLKNTEQQIFLLQSAMEFLQNKMSFVLKPHPNCPILSERYSMLGFGVSDESIDTLLTVSDVVYSNNVTSAAVDAYCAGIPVVSLVTPETLNMSPLRGNGKVLFVSCPLELADALNTVASNPLSIGQSQDFFFIDKMLPRWRQLILASSNNCME